MCPGGTREEELRQLAQAAGRGRPKQGTSLVIGDRRGGNRQDTVVYEVERLSVNEMDSFTARASYGEGITVMAADAR